MVNKSKTMRQKGHITRVKDKEHVYKIPAGIPKGQTPLELPRLVRTDNINL